MLYPLSYWGGGRMCPATRYQNTSRGRGGVKSDSLLSMTSHSPRNAGGNPLGDPHGQFVDVQRRDIVTEVVTKDDVQVLAVDKVLPGHEPERLLLNKVDAQRLKEALEAYLATVTARELSGLAGTLSPADMLELFGEED